MSDQTILEKFKNRCPVCNHKAVDKIILEVYCSYCKIKWQTIYDYEIDCEAKQGEWKLEDKISDLEDKIKTASDWSRTHCSREQNRKLQQILKGSQNTFKSPPVLVGEDARKFIEIDKTPLTKKEIQDLKESVELFNRHKL